MNRFSNILWGVLFIALAVILGLNGLGYFKINIFFKGWWTLLIIIPCFIDLFGEHDKLGDLIGILVGIILLLIVRDILDFDMIKKLIIPVILFIIGVYLIFKDAINKEVSGKIRTLNKGDLDNYSATFTEKKVNINNGEFKGANLNTIFGSINFDFVNTKLAQDKVINASSVFGGIVINPPKNINIRVKSTALFGGVTNKLGEGFDENLKTVYINAFSLFGGIEIK